MANRCTRIPEIMMPREGTDPSQMRGLRTYREGRSEPGVPLLFEMCGKYGILHGSPVYA